jgi:hypothetical protein
MAMEKNKDGQVQEGELESRVVVASSMYCVLYTVYGVY